MKIKRTILSLIFLFAAVSFSSLFAYQGENEDITRTDEYKEIYEASGADELFSALSSETQDFLREIKADDVAAESILDINPKDVLSGIGNEIKQKAKKPMSVFLSGVGIILLTAILNSMREGGENSAEETFSFISAAAMAAFIIEPVSQLIVKTADMLKNTSGFITAFLPVYSGLLTASGKPITSAVYPASLMLVTELMSTIASTVLAPMMSVYLAFCLIGSLSLKMNISLLGEKMKSFSIFVLGFILTLFTGLFTIKGVVSASLDTVSMKGAKFLSSAFLPVVGGAIADAMNAVGGCLSLIKSSVGGFFIIAVFSSFLPYVISSVLYIAAFEALSFIAEIMGAKSLTNLMKSTVSVLSILLSIIAVFLIAIITSVTIMLTVMK